MKTLSIDLETYSSVDIRTSGMYKYVASPDFQILLFAYSVDGAPAEIVDLVQGEELPIFVRVSLVNPNVTKIAYNAAFEWCCLSRWLADDLVFDRYQWLKQWRCTMVHATYLGYPAGLEVVAEALKLTEEQRKMAVGKQLIRYFCVPCKPTKTNGGRTRNLPHHDLEKWELFKTYCCQDVAVEQAIVSKLAHFSAPVAEWDLWRLDLNINATGVRLDTSLVEGALRVSEVVTQALIDEAVALTGLENPNSTTQLSEWLKGQGVTFADLRKETVETLLSAVENPTVKRVLEQRQALAKTSVKKYEAMAQVVGEDGRARGLIQYYGANRTGRWSGRLIQVQNLPRHDLKTLDVARRFVIAKNIPALQFMYGNVLDTLSQLIRTAFIPSEGHTLAIADFAAIEARVIAWLAGEQWRLDVFATHGKLYEASAAHMFGVPVEKIVKGNPEYELRQKGKVAELALGYGGSVNALINMGALEMGLTEEELPDMVQRWRASNKRITDLWRTLNQAALSAFKHYRPVAVKHLLFAREYDVANGLDFLTIQLPSGRKLYYANPFLSENRFGQEALFYYGVDQTTKKWGQISTYGGKLVENVVQAIARDCLAETLKRVHKAGYQTVMHVHDEVVVEVQNGETDLERILQFMREPMAWAADLKLEADGFLTDYYQKD